MFPYGKGLVRDFLFDLPIPTRFLDRGAFLCKVLPVLVAGASSGAGFTVSPAIVKGMLPVMLHFDLPGLVELGGGIYYPLPL
jgi:hypothetical protein